MSQFRAGEVVTARLSGGVGAEKDKDRPAVVVCAHDETTLIVAVTDARKSRMPTHVSLGAFASGTDTKEALATCEHAWSVDAARLEARPGARPLTADELARVGRAMRLALGVVPPGRPPPGDPKHRRGSVVEVDLSGAIGAEATGVVPALVLSNDTGNYFGRTFLVAPRGAAGFDLRRLRVVDVERIIRHGFEADVPADELTRISAELDGMLPTA